MNLAPLRELSSKKVAMVQYQLVLLFLSASLIHIRCTAPLPIGEEAHYPLVSRLLESKTDELTLPVFTESDYTESDSSLIKGVQNADERGGPAVVYRQILQEDPSVPGILRFDKRAPRPHEWMSDKRNMPGVLRFGKRSDLFDDEDALAGIIEVGKRDIPGVLRFGKRGILNPGDIRLDKRAMPGVLRFGKRAMPGVLRFGKRAMPGVLRFGKR
ncbi:hypothetical protein AB6A40_001011 [Gnathostoma spinigerum]|uniref:Uncharacterized protein n=1 Tax=Gnathostoma spinigerum TaxID=75299 RepID=A0ABD6ECT1_9BILA